MVATIYEVTSQQSGRTRRSYYETKSDAINAARRYAKSSGITATVDLGTTLDLPQRSLIAGLLNLGRSCFTFTHIKAVQP